MSVLRPFQTFMLKKGALHLYSKRAPTPSLPLLPLLPPLPPLCTLKAQVEAGVSQLNIYTFLAFIPLRTYLTSMNGGLLTPFNSHSKQVLLAQLTCDDELCNVSPPLLHLLHKRDFVNTTKLFRRSMSHVAS